MHNPGFLSVTFVAGDLSLLFLWVFLRDTECSKSQMKPVLTPLSNHRFSQVIASSMILLTFCSLVFTEFFTIFGALSLALSPLHLTFLFSYITKNRHWPWGEDWSQLIIVSMTTESSWFDFSLKLIKLLHSLPWGWEFPVNVLEYRCPS